MNSNSKGKKGELELCKELPKYFDCQTRRSQQYCGAAGDADIVGLPGIHAECKRVEKLNIDNAIQQAVDDSVDSDTPAVFHRKNRKDWLVTVRLSDLPDMIKKLQGIIKNNEENIK